MDYPKYFSKCPICGSTERIVEQEVNEAKSEGKIAQERIPCSQLKVIPIIDPASMPLVFSTLQIYYDYCANCGFEYPHTITKQKMTPDQLGTLMGQTIGIVSKNPGKTN
jgi:transcription elongation factor Elf1